MTNKPNFKQTNTLAGFGITAGNAGDNHCWRHFDCSAAPAGLPLEERKEEQDMSHASQLVLTATGQCLATSKWQSSRNSRTGVFTSSSHARTIFPANQNPAEVYVIKIAEQFNLRGNVCQIQRHPAIITPISEFTWTYILKRIISPNWVCKRVLALHRTSCLAYTLSHPPTQRVRVCTKSAVPRRSSTQILILLTMLHSFKKH